MREWVCEGVGGAELIRVWNELYLNPRMFSFAEFADLAQSLDHSRTFWKSECNTLKQDCVHNFSPSSFSFSSSLPPSLPPFHLPFLTHSLPPSSIEVTNIVFTTYSLSPSLLPFSKQTSLWAAGDMERSRAREMSKHVQDRPDKLSKAEKLDKLDKLERLERMERSEKVGRLEAQMLSKIRAGVDTMALGSKEMEYLMEEELRVCKGLLRCTLTYSVHGVVQSVLK